MGGRNVRHRIVRRRFVLVLDNPIIDLPITSNESSYVITITITSGVGRTLALYVVERYHRQSVLIFALVTVLVISICILFYEIASETPDWGLRIFC